MNHGLTNLTQIKNKYSVGRRKNCKPSSS